MIHVFIVGCKGVPAQYGGFETFVERLTAGKKNQNIKYHVSCMNNDEKHFEYNDADCFNVKVPLPGAPGRILHVGLVLKQVEKWVQNHRAEKTIIYILGCRIGPLLIPHAMKLHRLGVRILCNPDGLEWKRDKWNAFEKKFLKFCEKCLVLNSDLIVCDSVNIEKYIKQTYKKKANYTTYIAYGADLSESICEYDKFIDWCNKYDIKANNYYLIVGRFVPENNYETMITEFMKSKTRKDLVIVTNVEKNKFYEQLRDNTSFETDVRIKFVGTVYDSELLNKIRENAYAYLHGHEVGGTNPSLLEALASTKLNLLLDVGFNREVGEGAAIYWNKQINNLSRCIEEVDKFEPEVIQRYGVASRRRITEAYTWEKICDSYEKVFME